MCFYYIAPIAIYIILLYLELTFQKWYLRERRAHDHRVVEKLYLFMPSVTSHFI